MKAERREPPIAIGRCPFDSGPPLLEIEINAEGAGAGEIGVVDAYVWCHECGARGPRRDTYAFDDSDVTEVMLAACKAWNVALRATEPQPEKPA